MRDSDKRTSLLRQSIHFRGKMFYNTDPGHAGFHFALNGAMTLEQMTFIRNTLKSL